MPARRWSAIPTRSRRLEECYRFAELVFPKLPLKKTTGNDRGPAKNAGPFGEMVANVVRPGRAKVAAAAG